MLLYQSNNQASSKASSQPSKRDSAPIRDHLHLQLNVVRLLVAKDHSPSNLDANCRIQNGKTALVGTVPRLGIRATIVRCTANYGKPLASDVQRDTNQHMKKI